MRNVLLNIKLGNNCTFDNVMPILEGNRELNKINDNYKGFIISNNKRGNFNRYSIIHYNSIFDLIYENMYENTEVTITNRDNKYLCMSIKDINCDDDCIATTIKFIYALTIKGNEFVESKYNTDFDYATIQTEDEFFGCV